jgi:hypothetical protein
MNNNNLNNSSQIGVVTFINSDQQSMSNNDET